MLNFIFERPAPLGHKLEFFELFCPLKKARNRKKWPNRFRLFPSEPYALRIWKGVSFKRIKKREKKRGLLTHFQLEKLHKNKVSSGSQVFCLRQLQLVASQCGKLVVKRRGKVTVP